MTVLLHTVDYTKQLGRAFFASVMCFESKRRTEINSRKQCEEAMRPDERKKAQGVSNEGMRGDEGEQAQRKWC